MLLPMLAMSSGGSFAAVGMALGNAFAGGVMLAAGLVHMLNEALQDYDGNPRAPLLMCLMGILVPFALEKGGLLFFFIQHSYSSSQSSAVSGQPLLNHTNKDLPDYSGISQGSEDPSESSVHKQTCIMPSLSSTHLQIRLDFLREASNQSLDLVDHAATVIPKSHNHHEMLTNNDELFEDTHEQAFKDVRHTHFSVSWFLLTLILVCHSLLAGFTLGVEPPDATPALFMALMLHKVFESVAMGVASTHQQDSSPWVKKVQFLTYCLAAPLGVAIGHVFSESADAPLPRTRALITAVTSGSFLYISLVEITQEEFMDEQNRVKKFVCFSLGAIAMVHLV